MKKSLILLLSLCAFIAIGTILFTNKTQDKAETIPKQTKSLVKQIEQQKVSHIKAMETLNTQKVSLQKQLLQNKVDLQKTKSSNQVLVQQVKQLKDEVQQKPIQDTSQALILCNTLAITIDSLLVSNALQDSLFTLQTNSYDSLVCVQENQITAIANHNQNLQTQVDTLIAFNKSLQSQNKSNQRKLVFRNVGNKLLASGLIVTTTLATYLSIKNRI